MFVLRLLVITDLAGECELNPGAKAKPIPAHNGPNQDNNIGHSTEMGLCKC